MLTLQLADRGAYVNTTVTVDFREATDRLMEIGVSLADLAEEMDASHGLLRQARIDPASASYRRPPEGWREAAARLARTRGGKAFDLAENLEQESEGV